MNSDSDIAPHVHDALSQVRRLRETVLEKRLFRGYSGRARIVSGLAALAGAAALDSGRLPETNAAWLGVWGAVLALALALNYGGLLLWFFSPSGGARDLRMIRPAATALPALLTGAALTVALVRIGALDLLYGTWMACYGLAHLPYRTQLPRANFLVGLGYLVAGGLALLAAPGLFRQPWAMGAVYFVGETAGGWALLIDRPEESDA